MWKKYTKIMLMVAILLTPYGMAKDSKINVVVSISDFVPIAREIGGEFVNVSYILPPGMDPHSFSLTNKDIEKIKKADIIVLANSDLLSYEKKIKENYRKDYLDFPDYEKNGATLATFNDFENNPHGYWLKAENAIAIARTIAYKLMQYGHSEYFEKRFEEFKKRVEMAKNCTLNESIAAGIYGKKVVASVPGVCYIAENYGIITDEILLSEGTAYVSMEKMHKIESKLQNGSYLGIVVPLFMKNSKAGKMAATMARDTGSRVIYVKFSMGGESYESILYYNMAQFLEPVKMEKKNYNMELIVLCVSLSILAAFEGGIIYVLWRRR